MGRRRGWFRSLLGSIAVSGFRARLATTVLPFPPAPLKFRTAGFPQYGFKASLSGGTFRHDASVKSAPDVAFASWRLSAPFVLSKPSFPSSSIRVEVGGGWSTAVREARASLPQGPSLRSGL